MDFAELLTDPTLEKRGKWVKNQDAEFLIASSNSPKYQRALRRHAQTESATKVKNDPETQDRVLVEAMADAILLDWRGEVKLKGVDMPCNRENKIKLLQIAAFRHWVAEQMQDIANFQAEEDKAEDAEGKSPSTGS